MEGNLTSIPYRRVLKRMNMNWQPLVKVFQPKRKRRGPLWASLIGLGLSAAVFGVTRGKRKDFGNMAVPFRNAIKNLSPKTNLNFNDNTALAEFSEELMESALKNER